MKYLAILALLTLSSCGAYEASTAYAPVSNTCSDMNCKNLGSIHQHIIFE